MVATAAPAKHKRKNDSIGRRAARQLASMVWWFLPAAAAAAGAKKGNNSCLLRSLQGKKSFFFLVLGAEKPFDKLSAKEDGTLRDILGSPSVAVSWLDLLLS